MFINIMKSVFRTAAWRVSEWEKSALAAPVAKERIELSRWLIRCLWALEGGDGLRGTSAGSRAAVGEASGHG